MTLDKKTINKIKESVTSQMNTMIASFQILQTAMEVIKIIDTDILIILKKFINQELKNRKKINKE